MQLIQAVPETLLSWLAVMAGFLAGLSAGRQAFLLTFVVGGVAVAVSIARQPAPGRHTTAGGAVATGRPQDDMEDHLRGLRIAGEDRERADWGWGPAPVLDSRTAELVIDPTLRPAEVAEMVEHVAPGAGSVVSVAGTAVDTTMRGPRALAELAAAELAAYDEAERRADAAFFARFDSVMEVAMVGFRERTARVDTWMHYLHGDEDSCPRCTAAAAEISAEHRQIVSQEDTKAFDLHELHAALALR